MRDSSQIRQGMADYVLAFRKTPPGDNLSTKPIERPNGFERYIGDPAQDPRETDQHPSKYARKGRDGRTSVEIWRRYAEPVWWDIDQTDVLNFRIARDEKDEKHICPLQLGLIRRCVELWSAEGDVVLSPFAGVGSEGFVALDEGRKFIGIELKPGYFSTAIKHLESAEAYAGAQGGLFDAID
jgi:DNA modification methylase